MKPLLAALVFAPLALVAANSVEGPRCSYLERANPLPEGVVTGKLEGRVVFDGELPIPSELEMPEDKAKGCTKPGVAMDKTDRSLLISKELGIKNVVVSIAVADAKIKVPEKPIPLDQVACTFEPHVILLPVGATVEFLNSDTISHNVRTLPRKHEPLNKAVGPGLKESQTFDQGADKIEIKCDYHPWMNAWLIVSDTPYSTVTDADGNFTIPDLPPGEYKLTVWQERLPKPAVEATATVRPDGTSDVVLIKMAPKKKKRE
ncbi:MAG TPA: carboxypeptidase regulatory-like domain-containing protein [Polyangiales bacterium]|nr:carboxypeptidase regulatory-like domain-containing protein [Polyangiales bacterium]